MENISTLIQSELFVLVPVLYLLGMWFKKAKWIKDEYIPITIGVLGAVFTCLYLKSISFSAVIQGVLCAGCAVYANQLKKQGGKL